VAELAGAVAAAFSLPLEDIEVIRQAAELHDVGKVGIPDAILNKPAALDGDEWALMRRHTLIGERILAAAPDLARAARLVRSSHENYDGSGYPDGLARREIPLGSRIIAVCDAFHAMTTDRPYRPAVSEAAAVQELRRCAGSQFDPDVVERFCAALAGGGTGTLWRVA
ncbi:MAG: HD domain-containing protein, partial [Solirubrobacterales bacterium]|nr:HD domain-containing protein [Solirubrobacterales bacterium]